MNEEVGSEKIVLGELLKNRAKVESVSRIIGPDYFTDATNEILYSELLEYAEQHKKVEDFSDDIVHLRRWLKGRGRFAAVGGNDYIVELFETTNLPVDVDMHVDMIREDFFKRRGAEITTHYAEQFRNGAGLAELLSGLQGELDALKNEAECHAVCPIRFTPLTQVDAKAVSWFWPNRIPAGMLSMIVGNPGIGKSFLTMYVAAQITTGRNWPDAENTMEPGSVLLFSDEESLEYAIKPRLLSQGADCSKVFAFNSLDLKGQAFTIQDRLRHLETYLDNVPDCRLIIFDPITAYLGNANENSNSDVRGVLLGLQQLAQRRHITVIGVSHFSKKSDLEAIYRTLGSTAFTAAARSVWAVVTEKTDIEGQRPARLFLPVKSNYSVDVDGLRFNLIDGQVAFDGQVVHHDIDKIMQGGHTPAQKNEASNWLRERLGTDAVLAGDVLSEGEQAGYSYATIQRAATDLGVIKRRSAMYTGKPGQSMKNTIPVRVRNSYRWQLTRGSYRKEHPCCENPFGLLDHKEIPADVVHHRQPVREYPGLSEYSRQTSLKVFGSEEKWAQFSTELLHQYSFNGCGGWSQAQLLRNTENPLVYTLSWDFMADFAISKCRCTKRAPACSEMEPASQ